jgi:hypothetical protein
MFLCAMLPDIKKAPGSDPDQVSAEWVKLERLPELNIFPTALRHIRELIAGATQTYWGDVY